jgi:hypothetical protein
MRHDPDFRVGERGQDIRRSVGAAVVDDDDLPFERKIDRPGEPHGLGHGVLLVVDRHDDRERAVVHGGVRLT